MTEQLTKQRLIDLIAQGVFTPCAGKGAVAQGQACAMQAVDILRGGTGEDDDPLHSLIDIAVRRAQDASAEIRRWIVPHLATIAQARVNPRLETQRMWIVIDTFVRDLLPLLVPAVTRLRACEPVVDRATAESALDLARGLDLDLDLDLALGLDLARDLARAESDKRLIARLLAVV